MSKWLDSLQDEDLNFMKRFILASGSLKDLADIYGVSYPTIRLRLDRLIKKIELAESEKPISELERTLRLQMAEGKVDSATFKLLMDAHRRDVQRTQGEPA